MHVHNVLMATQLDKHRNEILAAIELANVAKIDIDFTWGKATRHLFRLLCVAGIQVAIFKAQNIGAIPELGKLFPQDIDVVHGVALDRLW